MNRRFFIALAACLLAIQPVLHARASVNEQAKAQQMADRAVAYFKEHGGEATIKAINAGGSFRDGELYVFMLTIDGVSVANAADQTNVGRNSIDLKDSTGKPYVREILDRASEDGAWVRYTRINPATGKDQLKMSWVRKVEGYVIGCGVYLSD
jgi:cytochrome c